MTSKKLEIFTIHNCKIEPKKLGFKSGYVIWLQMESASKMKRICHLFFHRALHKAV